MKVILVMVQTMDGKTTKWSGDSNPVWSSVEDRAHFQSLLKNHRLLVMGKKTYESAKSTIALTPALRRIVLTTHPEAFKDDQTLGQLEFSGETPKQLVDRLSKEGYDDLLLVGGSKINKAFLEEQQIDECIVTVEPRIFGSGNALFDSLEVDISLKLLDSKRLNNQGALVLHYAVSYDH